MQHLHIQIGFPKIWLAGTGNGEEIGKTKCGRNGKQEEAKQAKLEQETAGISSDYGAVQLKDRPARHLLGNLFTLYAEINAGVKGQHGKRCTAWFKSIFHSLENSRCETFVLIFASWSISDYLCFSVTSINTS